MNYKLLLDPMTGSITSISYSEGNRMKIIPLVSDNTDYLTYISDIKTHGMSIVTCIDCGDGIPNDSMWQYLDNAEQLVIDKYGSDLDKLTALREDRYVRAMEAKTAYEKKIDAFKIIDATSQEIKDKYRHLPMRR